MTWQWVCVLAIVVAAWTVHRVTKMWQEVSAYRYAPDYVKSAIAKQSGYFDGDD